MDADQKRMADALTLLRQLFPADMLALVAITLDDDDDEGHARFILYGDKPVIVRALREYAEREEG